MLALALIASGPWLGFWTVLPLALAGVAFRIAETRIEKAKRPEIGLFVAWTASQAITAIAVAMTGGPNVPTMAWFAIPLISLSARFSERGIALGVAITIALMLGVAFGVDAQAVMDNPPLVIAPFALVISISIFQTVLMRSDVDTRAEAVIDPLTGMLNRKALDSRTLELKEQSSMTGEPVGLVVGDIDHFKQINDSLGHATGDAVLKEVAYVLRKALRAFDLAYRIGGEEFLVMLPGAGIEQTAELAEQLRLSVAGARAGGQGVTMSFGVAASEQDEGFDYEPLFEQADSALYEAKAAGRDCVRRAAEAREPRSEGPVPVATPATEVA
ncbi:MAG: GGDEF domain-containing protein [Thermoleophilaceae bacterium]